MYKYILESVDGVNLFGISALLLFFTVFCVVAIKVFLFSSKDANEQMARMPLED